MDEMPVAKGVCSRTSRAIKTNVAVRSGGRQAPPVSLVAGLASIDRKARWAASYEIEALEGAISQDKILTKLSSEI